ncbi:hypothetical protein FA10DRAFT_37079 [Acaromyces ingoldii]|uniref:Uncharacterized protein n=1 Tax=Acaromyces ingoldii TaxID=215250 RepID=A0A316YY29_9BASI|nr:hypothetical protein FA10DRAFT_37079 [Acaromyces ingoldii]PWN93956.1 hypothetical protein FA10DRAFT_37079 [Acaromyces ingoldii]
MRLVAASYPDLASRHIKTMGLGGLYSDHQELDTVSLRRLVDPRVSERLVLQNSKGARLAIIFAIVFDQWGHARPKVRVEPLPPLGSELNLSANAKRVIDEMPARFAHLCAHAPLKDGRGIATATQVTICAFFDVV